jgi:suppressor for copper-sensitivity B
LSISFGFSIPYILFTINPRVIYIFPKPGKWMENFKYLLGVLLLVTFIWLLNISNVDKFLILSFNTILLLFSLCIDASKFRCGLTVGTIFLLLLLFLKPISHINEKVTWTKFNEVLLNKHLEADELVFLDFTADWCATCQINKITTLDSFKLKKFFNDNDIKTLRADWTKKDDKILDFIIKYDRYGIPLNIVYGPKNKNGKILPEILTKDIVIKNINLVK